MAKKDNLDPKEAQEIVKKFCEPPYNAEEIRLKEDVRLVLKGGGKGYEGDDDEEEEEGDSPQNNEPKGGAGESAAQGATSQATQSQGSSVIENVQQYAGEVIANVQSLGTAGSVALSSATYFQAETVVESSHDIVAIVEEVEEDYDMTLQNYFVETTATFIDDIAHIPIIENIPVVNTVVENTAKSLYSVSDNMETKAERVEKQEAEAEQKAAEQEAKQAEKAEAEAEKEAAREEAKEERKAEREAKKAERQAEKEAEAEETEEAEEEVEEETKEAEEQEESKEESEEASEEAEEVSENETSEEAVEETETKAEAEVEAEAEIMETPVDNDMMDEIKPHSNIESDDAGNIIDDFPKVETPFLDDSSVRPVSPVAGNANVSPAT